jgi:DNA-binding transcriptional regulator YdaS (Cro superfamily)
VNKVRRGARISAEMSVAIEKATNRKVTRGQFRPDLFDDVQRVAS